MNQDIAQSICMRLQVTMKDVALEQLLHGGSMLDPVGQGILQSGALELIGTLLNGRSNAGI